MPRNNNPQGPLERTAYWGRSGRSIPIAAPVKKRRLFAYIKKAVRLAHRQAQKPPPR